MIIGISWVALFSFRRRQVVNPSMTGIITSRRIRSGASAATFSRPYLSVGGTDCCVAEVFQLLLEIVHVERLVIDDENFSRREHGVPQPVAREQLVNVLVGIRSENLRQREIQR